MNRLLVAGAIAALAIADAPAAAQTTPPPGVAQGTTAVVPIRPVPRVPQVRERMHMMMSDRTLTREELLQHVRAMFARLDANKDGYVTSEEIEGFHHGFAGTQGDMHRRIEKNRPMRGDRAQIFDRLDANHDGVISREEFMRVAPQVRERRVMIMRKDAGMPGMDDMHMPEAGIHEMGIWKMRMHRPGGGERLFEMADKNHDGRVSLQEAENAALAHFDRADLNHDGKITPDERRKAHEMMRRERRPG